jgi:hypothetical protein
LPNSLRIFCSMAQQARAEWVAGTRERFTTIPSLSTKELSNQPRGI